MSARHLLLVVLGLVLSSCHVSSEKVAKESSEAMLEAPLETAGPVDAGDQAWVKRVVPLMWGRRPLSIGEVQALSEMTRQLGRSMMVRIMARHPDYRERWSLFFKDALGVARLGFSANPGCYGRRVRPMVTSEVAQFVADNGPDGAALNPSFTMLDVIDSALLLDDVSSIYTANLLANLYKHIDDMHLLASIAQRRNRAQAFMSHYLHRRTSCMGCHNSEFSVTQDRTFPVGGYFEKALFGESGGRDIMSLTRYFRRKGVIAGYYYTHDDESMDDELLAEDVEKSIRPWGWDPTCGAFLPQEMVARDDFEPPRDEWLPFFAESGSENASVYEIHDRLRSGFNAIRGTETSGLSGDVDPDEAFAYLVSMNLADKVWAEAFGSRLTIAHYFPRNPSQRDELASLTSTFVKEGFSLVSLISKVATHPYFNGAVPGEGEPSEPYDAVFDPFVQEGVAMGDRTNHLGHAVFRAGARTLLRSVYKAMGWQTVPEYLLYYLSPSARLQRSTGVYLKSGDAGFSGTNFQSALAWEAHFGVCEDRSTNANCPLDPILNAPVQEGVEATICELCINRDYACDWDARCCDVSWDTYCDETCDTGDPDVVDLRTFPAVSQPVQGDWINTLVSRLENNSETTVGEALAELKNRLLNQPEFEADGELQVLETLIGTPLSELVSDSPDIEQHLRRACGVFLSTPEFQLLGLPSEDVRLGTVTTLIPEMSFQARCQALADTMFDAGAVQCGAHALKIAADD